MTLRWALLRADRYADPVEAEVQPFDLRRNLQFAFHEAPGDPSPQFYTLVVFDEHGRALPAGARAMVPRSARRIG
jgi:hypothetical protein